jgi:UDP-N-acetylmuramoylalanine--D-glutamate ligase
MKIALIGYGQEGQSAYQYYKAQFPDAEFVIYDEAEKPKFDAPEDAELICGPDVLQDVIEADLVVRCSPPINPSRIRTSAKLTSPTREFFDNCPAPIIGVTGTKGKGTTASLTNSILQASGKMSWLVGNIGTPALDVLPEIKAEDVVVFELSSFQLWDLTVSPHVAVVLMIEPDHLDVHTDFNEYIDAKANIRRYQTDQDICFYHPGNEQSARIASSGSAGRVRRYSIKADGAVYVKANTFFVHNHPICETKNLRLEGEHNLENACAAISAAMEFDVSDGAVAEGLASFEGLPHRLKLVEEVRGVKFYDDSIATTPGSAIAALRAFEKPKIIILGGSDKGAEYDDLIDECARHEARVIAIGTTGKEIARQCRESGIEVAELGRAPMADIVGKAAEMASSGDVVILSPASASFDMFKSYADRGDQFISAVEAL